MAVEAETEALGALLKRYRRQAGLTQEELAERAGISARSVSDIERGLQQRPYITTLRRLADALGLAAEPRVVFLSASQGTSLSDMLIDHLHDKHLLLVLDNLEHLLDAAGAVARLLDACRELHVLVTSRIPLHLVREHEYSVPPLSLPAGYPWQRVALPPLEALCQYEAVALFVERAQAVKPEFAVTNDNARSVAEICARLDGLPLAIELAATRIKLFPPQALLQRLESCLKLLTGGARDVPTRQ
jgi:non-specific serine/threonine protein kinase